MGKGFTLIELLAVIAILGVLTALVFGLTRGVSQRGAIARAQSELTAISQALEEYKLMYGDYPQTDRPPRLYQALNGTLGPTMNLIPSGEQRGFIEDHSKFTLHADDPESVPNYFEDPWGNPYQYYYKHAGANSWERFGFLLFSQGPDGEHSPPPATGYINVDHPDNTDNIFHDRN